MVCEKLIKHYNCNKYINDNNNNNQSTYKANFFTDLSESEDEIEKIISKKSKF